MNGKAKKALSCLCAIAVLITSVFAFHVVGFSADEQTTWDLFDDDFSKNHFSAYNYAVNSAGGEIVQRDGDDFVRITDNSFMAFLNMLKKTNPDLSQNYVLPQNGAVTIEIRAKINPVAKSDFIQFLFKTPKSGTDLYLTWDGTKGTAQDRATSPDKSITLDTTVYHDYRIIRHEDYSYSLYVDGKYAWTATNKSTGTVTKIGCESQSVGYADVKYIRAATGEHIPQEGYIWDQMNDDMSDYSGSGWDDSVENPEGSGIITQNEGIVSIEDGDEPDYTFIQKKAGGVNWGPANGAYTVETRARLYGTSEGAGFTISNESGKVVLFLSNDGEQGIVKNRMENPEKTYAVDTSAFHDYRIVVHDDYTYDLYIDNYLVWENAPKTDSEGDAFKIGFDEGATGKLEVDYVRIATGEHAPVPLSTVPPEGGSEYTTVKKDLLVKIDDDLADYTVLWEPSADGVVTEIAEGINIKDGTISWKEANPLTTPPKAFTLEIRAKINTPGSVSEIKLEHTEKPTDSSAAAFYLKYGTGNEDTISEKLTDPDHRFKIDTSKYNRYILVAHNDVKWETNQKYDLYVDTGEEVYQVWKDYKIHYANTEAKSYLRIGAANGHTTDMDIDYIKLVYDTELIPDGYIPAPENEVVIPIRKGTWSAYEAELATLNGTSVIEDASAYNGKSVGGFDTVGDNVTFENVKAGNALSIEYSSEAEGTISLYINGEKYGSVAVENTGGPKNYREAVLYTNIAEGSTVKVQLDPGDNAIRLDAIRTFYGYPAENAEISGGAAIYEDEFAEGGKAVSLASEGAKITFRNAIASDEIAIGYSAEAGGKISVYVNGEHAKEIYSGVNELDLTRESTKKFEGERAYDEQSIYIDIPENATITLQLDPGDTATNIDYIKLNPKPVLGERPISEKMIIGAYVGNSDTRATQFDEFLYGENPQKHIAVLAYYGQANWIDWEGGSWQFGALWNKIPNEVLMSIPIIPEDIDKANPVNANLSDAAKGVYNNRYITEAKKIYNNLKDKTDEIHIRIGWEFNGNWYPYTIDPTETGELLGSRVQDYIGAYRQVVNCFRSVSDKFRFEWCPNLGTGSVRPDLAYPGDDYVDIIGMDVYDETKWTPIHDPVERFQYTINRDYGLLWHREFARAHGKRMAYSEWGVGGNGSGDSPYIVEAMYNWFLANNVALQSYWDGGASSGYNGQLTGGQYPNAAARYIELFGSYDGPPTSNTSGNLITAVTSPKPFGNGGTAVTLNKKPAVIKGISLDPDGNEYINWVKVTVKKKSTNEYLDVSKGTFVSEPIFNEADYNPEDGYWTLDISNIYFVNDQYTITAYADDGENPNETGTCNFTLQSSNNAPQLGHIGNKSAVEGKLLAFTVNATDSDGDDLAYSALGLPAGAIFNSETGEFSWTPGSSQAGTYTVRFIVSDGEATDYEDVQITVTEARDTIITIDPIPDKKPGELVTVSGTTVFDRVSVKVVKPDSTLYDVDSVEAINGNYSYTFALPGDVTGTYTVVAGRGNDIATATFRVSDDDIGDNDEDEDDGNDTGDDVISPTPAPVQVTPSPKPRADIDEIMARIDSVVGSVNKIRDEDASIAALNELNEALGSLAGFTGLSNVQQKEVVQKVNSAVSAAAKLLNNIETPEKVVQAGENIIDSVSGIAEMIKAPGQANKLSKEIVKAIETVVAVAGRTKAAVSGSGDTSTCLIDDSFADELMGKAELAVRTAEELNARMRNKGLKGEAGKKLSIVVDAADESKTVSISISPVILSGIKEKGIEKVEITAGLASMEFSPDFIISKGDIAGLTITASKLEVNEENMAGLNEKQRELAESGTGIYDFDLIAKINGADVKVSNFNKSITISLPYDLKAGENPEKITVLYLADNGEIKNMAGRYDPETRLVSFTTRHFSRYLPIHYHVSFNDVTENHWAKNNIEVMASKGIVNGVSATRMVFMPDKPVTRAEFAKMLVMAQGLLDEDAVCNFKDVSQDEWYTPYIASAYQAGIIAGMPDGTFRPNDVITREQMAAMLSRALNIERPENALELIDFADENAISEYARQDVALIVTVEIMNGKPNKLFDPQGVATRAEAATTIYRLFNY